MNEDCQAYANQNPSPTMSNLSKLRTSFEDDTDFQGQCEKQRVDKFSLLTGTEFPSFSYSSRQSLTVKSVACCRTIRRVHNSRIARSDSFQVPCNIDTSNMYMQETM